MNVHSLSDLRAVNSFAALPAAFYTRLAPQPLNQPRLLHANADAAALIGLDPSALRTPEFLRVFSGAEPLPGGDTLAAVYSGHQFGVWAGQLATAAPICWAKFRDREAPGSCSSRGRA